MRVARWVGAAVVVVLVIAGITLGGWQIGWWFKSHNVSREAKVYQQSYGAQTADMDKFGTDIQAINDINVQIQTPGVTLGQIDALRAQKAGIVADACRFARRMNNNPPAEIKTFIYQNCEVTP